MKRLRVAGMIMLVCICWVSVTLAHTPLGGLTVAVSPDGKTIVAGGDSRVLYVLDAASLEVKERIWVKTTIWGLTFNQDGSKLLVEDTSSTLFFLNTSDWKLEREVKNMAFLKSVPSLDLGAAKSSTTEISFIALTDAALKGKAAVPLKIAAFGLSPDGTKLAVISPSEKDDSEPTVKSADVPKDLKDAAKVEYVQQNDGKTATFYLFEVPSGKELSSQKVYYTTNEGATVVFDGENVLFVNYANENAQITPQGDITIFQLLNSYNYGIGASADQKYLGSGGLRDGTVTKVDGLASLTFKIDTLPGWPEYFKGFDFDAEGNAYGATTGYRIIKIKPDGTIVTSVPIY